MTQVQQVINDLMDGNPITSHLIVMAIASGMDDIIKDADSIISEEQETIKRGQRPLVSAEHLVNEARRVRLTLKKQFEL